jgi:superfamily I DNA/RNA helicase
VVASYTKAAATVLNRRQLPIPRENIGTLHALCYRGLKQYEIAEINAKAFNEEYPGDEISLTGSGQMDELAVDAVYVTEGDKHLNTYNLFRAKCLELHTMPKNTIEWVKKWENWKYRANVIDFTDMINITLCMDKPMAGEPTVGIFDEVQDFNALEMKLIRHWAQYMDHTILAGDDDQCIYNFVGASPEAFLSHDVAADHKRVLNKSWRLPRKIHEFSQRWIKQIANREPKEFMPKDVEGNVSFINATYRTPNAAIELAARYAQDGKTVMLLASCGYLLNTIKTQLRSAGLPFWNPYRQSRGDWNPMGSFHNKQAGRISTRERILSFLSDSVSGQGYWSAEDLARWIELVRVKGILKKGAKDKIISLIDDQQGIIYDEAEFYAQIFEDFALEHAVARDLKWFKESLLSAKRTAVEYPLAVYGKQGRAALEEKPKIILGTVHSVKGGESDATIIFPDLSLAAMQDFKTNRDSTIRTFYVGITRSRESLIICQPASDMSVKFN